jgi:hypothetical protein
VLSLKDIGWLAGLLEGEGCFVARSKAALRISISTTDRDVAARAAAMLGARVLDVKPQTPTNKPVYCVKTASVAAAGWMMTIYPLMGVRRKARIRELISRWRGHSRDGWVIHRAKFGCSCSSKNGACSRHEAA